jgi:excisionase family DNA binding protein
VWGVQQRRTVLTADGELLSTRDAAKLLGVSLRTAQLWVESGVLRAWKTAGGHRKILRTSVDQILAERQTALRGARPEPARASLKILAVEDELDLLKLYRLNIGAWDLPLTLVTASSGFEGLIRVGESKPDLLITDLNMPGVDGFRMIRMLAGDPGFQNMMIVAVTALDKADIADRGGLPEGVHVFTKPVPFSELEKLAREKLAALRDKPATTPQPPHFLPQ